MILLLPIAFVAGVLTAFTPCALPVLPIIMASSLESKGRRIGIIVGLVTFFVLATLLLSVVAQRFGISPDDLRNISIFLLFIIGILLIFPHIWEKLQGKIEFYWHPPILGKGKSNFLGGFLTGGSLGAVWTPCVGPVVAIVTALTATSPLSLSAWLITISYGLGIGLSFWFIALFGSREVAKLNFVKKNNKILRQVFGLVVVFTAVFIYFGGDKALRSFALSVLPKQWTQAGSIFQDNPFIQRKIEELKPESGRSKDNMNSKKTKVKLEDLEQGCPKIDCIPSIDMPAFETKSEADKWLKDADVVFGINYKGVVRAYPQRILNWHEIVNDTLRLRSGQATGDPVVITFCPLCGSAIAFERKVNGREVEFGVSGKLYNSNLVMYDRNEKNYWQQLTGEAITGPAAERGEKLTQVSITTVSWGEWKKNFPNTQVLSKDTGFIRDYYLYPYGAYEENNEIYFGLQNTDNRLRLKEVVYGFDVEGRFKAYPEKVFNEKNNLDDRIGDLEVSLTRLVGGEIKLVDKQSKKEYLPLRTFWFAWAAFHPDTEIYVTY